MILISHYPGGELRFDRRLDERDDAVDEARRVDEVNALYPGSEGFLQDDKYIFSGR